MEHDIHGRKQFASYKVTKMLQKEERYKADNNAFSVNQTTEREDKEKRRLTEKRKVQLSRKCT